MNSKQQKSSTNQTLYMNSDDDNVFLNVIGAVQLNGGRGNDSFYIKQIPLAGVIIDGGTDDGISDAVVTYSGNTLKSGVSYSSQDIIYINKSIDISKLSFFHIEKIQLGSGIHLTMSSEQFEYAQNSLDYTAGTNTLNPGLHVQGVAGGKPEYLTIEVASGADFQLDDASTGFLFKNVRVMVHFNGGDVRYDGTAASESIVGGSGTEYITPRLGDDTVYAGAGNDLLVGQEGADKLYGEAGDDIFLINRLASRANGGIFPVGKASDGSAEWIHGDFIDGGDGIDELRITATGSSVTPMEDTVILTPDNFINVEKVTIGTNAPRDAIYPTTQDQMAAGALAPVTTGTDAINVNGSALNTNVIYTGNNGNNMLVGGSGIDELHGNGGNDFLVGGTGADKFYFETPLDVLTNVDTIGDFNSGIDQLMLNHAVFQSLPTGNLSSDSLVMGAVAVDSNDYILYNEGKLYYDADASSAGSAVLVAQLSGVATLMASDLVVF